MILSRGTAVAVVILVIPSLMLLGSWTSANQADEGSLLADSPWPMIHGGPDHNGRVDTVAVGGPSQVLWRVKVSSDITTSPTIGEDGTLYVGTDGGSLHAIIPAGLPLWSFETGGAIRSTPLVTDDGTIVFGSADGNVYAVSPNGKLEWSFQTGGPVNSSPSMGPEGTIYIGSDDHKLYALSRDGDEVWNVTTYGPITASPTVAPNGRIFVGSHDGRMYTVEQDGSILNSSGTGGIIRYAAALNPEGHLYFGSWDGDLYKMDLNGTVLWHRHEHAPTSAAPAIGWDGTVYVGTGQGELLAVLPSGETRWSLVVEMTMYTVGNETIIRVGTSAPVIDSDGNIIVGDSGGNLLVVGQAGVTIWNKSLEGYLLQSPSIGSDGTIYIPNHDTLVAVGERSPRRGLADVPVAMWFALLFGVALLAGLMVIGSRHRSARLKSSLGVSEEVGPDDGGEHHEPEQDREVLP